MKSLMNLKMLPDLLFVVVLGVFLVASACSGSDQVKVYDAQTADVAQTFTGKLTQCQITSIGANLDFAVGRTFYNRQGELEYEKMFPGEASPDSLLKAYDGIPYGLTWTGETVSVKVRLKPSAETDIEVTVK